MLFGLYRGASCGATLDNYAITHIGIALCCCGLETFQR